jgi:hypothetical protein
MDEDLDLHTEGPDATGRVIWPFYSALFATNFVDLVNDLANRSLYATDVWGFVPGTWRPFLNGSLAEVS